MNLIALNKIWNDLIELLTTKGKKINAINYLLAYAIDTNKIAEYNSKGEKSYNPAKLSMDDRNVIWKRDKDYWYLRAYLNNNNCINRYENIRESVHALYEILFGKENIHTVTYEIMSIVHVIIYWLPQYESKQSLIQRAKHQGMYYIDREECLGKIEASLESSPKNCIIISAPTGMGKKQISLDYVATHKDENYIWIQLPTSTVSLEEQIKDKIFKVKKIDNFITSNHISRTISPNNIDLSDLLDIDHNIIIIERPTLDIDDYAFICYKLHFTKAKLIILTAALCPDISCFTYNLPALDKNNLWDLFIHTIGKAAKEKQNTQKTNLISESEFDTILNYTDNNTFLITLLAKAIGKTALTKENKDVIRNYILNKRHSNDVSPLSYVSYRFPDNQTNEQNKQYNKNKHTYTSIFSNILFPIAEYGSKHFSEFTDICFFVSGTISFRILNLIFNKKDVKPVILEMICWGYAENLYNGIIRVTPLISDTLWNFRSKRSIENAQTYISLANKALAIDIMNLLRDDAPYYYSLIETIYDRLTSLIPLIGGRASRKGGNIVKNLWKEYWEILCKIYFLSSKLGNFNLAATVLDTLYSWNTSTGFKVVNSNESYFLNSALLHLTSAMSKGNLTDINKEFESACNSLRSKKAKISFPDEYYKIYFDFVLQYVFTNVFQLIDFSYNNPDVINKLKINNFIEKLFTNIEKSTLSYDWKMYYTAYARFMHAINRSTRYNNYSTANELYVAQKDLSHILKNPNDGELYLSSVFLHDCCMFLYYLYHLTLYPEFLSLVSTDIYTKGPLIETHINSLTLSEHYYMTKILFKTFTTKNINEIYQTINLAFHSLTQQTQSKIFSEEMPDFSNFFDALILY